VLMGKRPEGKPDGVELTRADDTALIASIARFSEDALGELYDRYSRLVYSLAYSTVGDVFTAEEITQDVFVSVWRNAKSFEPGRGKVSTWLISIARNRAIDMFRKGLRRRVKSPERRQVQWSELPETVPSLEDGPEEEAQSVFERERIRKAVAELPAEQREALALAFFRGYTHSEIARALSEPLGTIKTRIRIAMDKLRKILSNEQEKA